MQQVVILSQLWFTLQRLCDNPAETNKHLCSGLEEGGRTAVLSKHWLHEWPIPMALIIRLRVCVCVMHLRQCAREICNFCTERKTCLLSWTCFNLPSEGAANLNTAAVNIISLTLKGLLQLTAPVYWAVTAKNLMLQKTNAMLKIKYLKWILFYV